MLSGNTIPSQEVSSIFSMVVCGALVGPVVAGRWSYHSASSVSSTTSHYLLFSLEYIYSIALACSVITYLFAEGRSPASPTTIEQARHLIYSFSFTCVVSSVFIATRDPSSFECIPIVQLTATLFVFVVITFPRLATTIMHKVVNVTSSLSLATRTTVSTFISAAGRITLTATTHAFVSALASPASSTTIDNEGLGGGRQDADEENLDAMGVHETDRLISASTDMNGTFEEC